MSIMDGFKDDDSNGEGGSTAAFRFSPDQKIKILKVHDDINAFLFIKSVHDKGHIDDWILVDTPCGERQKIQKQMLSATPQTFGNGTLEADSIEALVGLFDLILACSFGTGLGFSEVLSEIVKGSIDDEPDPHGHERRQQEPSFKPR